MNIIEIEAQLSDLRQKEYQIIQQIQQASFDDDRCSFDDTKELERLGKLNQDLYIQRTKIQGNITNLKALHEQALKAQRERKDRQSNIRKITCSLLTSLPLDLSLIHI